MDSMSFEDLQLFLPPLLEGARTTVVLAVVSFCAGGVLGLAVALALISRRGSLRHAATVVVTLIMATPVLVQLLWLYYLLPIATGIVLPDLVVLALALSLNQAAIMAENYRSGLRAVPAGQRDGARMLGLSGWQSFRYVVLPQAVRAVLPLLASSSIVLVKDSAVATFIGSNDLLNSARKVAILTYRPIEVFTLAAVLYFVLTYPIAILSTALERRARRWVRPA
jgi:polar amino acid transport system permease protein